jgi:hypothetical protein
MADIKARKTIEEIESSWKEDVIAFKLIRSQYLLYTDFE